MNCTVSIARLGRALALAGVMWMGCAQVVGAEVTDPHDLAYWSPKNLGVRGIKGIPAPVDGVVGVDGRVWSVSVDGSSVTGISTSSRRGVAQRIGAQGGVPGRAQIASGADGLLVVPVFNDRGWRLARRSVDGRSSLVRLARSTVPVASSGISDLQAGPDGSVWFATTGWIGKVTAKGVVRAWKIPREKGYPLAGRPRLAVGADGLVYFTALGGVGSMSASGRFGPWQQVAADPSVPLAFIVRGGDEHLWVLGGDDDDRFYRKEQDGSWSTGGHYWDGKGSARTAVNEALAADPAGGILAIGASLLDGESAADNEWFLGFDVQTAAVTSPWDTWDPTEGNTPGSAYRLLELGPTNWDDIAQSPGRFAIVPLPDGRIWVSLRDWDGWESYEKLRGTRKAPPVGASRVQRVWRAGRTVLVRMGCTGKTGGWCRATVRASVGGRSHRTPLVVQAAPAPVHSASTARIRLSGKEMLRVKKGRKVTVRVGGRSWHV